MVRLVTLGIIGVAAVLLIAGIVAYQFMQQQSDRQAAIDLVNKQSLKAEYSSIYDAYSTEAAEKCSQYDNPNNLSETTPTQQKCYEDLMDKYGIFDKKYDAVFSEVIDERTERLIEAANELID